MRILAAYPAVVSFKYLCGGRGSLSRHEAAATSADSPALRLKCDSRMQYPKEGKGAIVQQYPRPWPCAEQLRRACGGFRIRSASFCNQFSATQKLRSVSQSNRTCQAMSQENTSLRPGSREAARYVLLVCRLSAYKRAPIDPHPPLPSQLRAHRRRLVARPRVLAQFCSHHLQPHRPPQQHLRHLHPRRRYRC